MNCIIVHGCPSSKKEKKLQTFAKHWLPWVKNKLNERGIKTEIALMPEPWHPDYKRFKQAFKEYDVNENTILIGHSCGTTFLVHWLSDTKQKVKKLIMVAPWKIPDRNDKWRKEFYEFPVDKGIKNRVKEIIMFTSNDERPDGKKSLQILHKDLGGKIIELKNHGHYTLNDMGTEEFPELLAEI
jgi:predicted alpha/beta hydrolase family esterase